MLRILAALVLAFTPTVAVGQDAVSWAFDRRLSDVEARLKKVETALGIKAAESPKAAPKSAEGPAKGYASPAAGTVTVDVPTGPGVGDRGTGAVVWSEGGVSLIVTNKHVVSGKQSPTALTVTINSTGAKHQARFVGWSDEGDAALLEVVAELPCVTIGNTASVGERVTHYGNTTGPQTGQIVSYSGNVTAMVYQWSGPVMNTNYASASGDSGSGVFNSRGELVGVHWGGGTDTRVAVPVYVVRTMLKRLVANRMPRLAARLAVLDAANNTGVAVAPPNECPGGICPVGASAPASTRTLWRVGNGPPTTEDEIRRQYPGIRFPHDASGGCVGGACGASGRSYCPSCR